MPGIREQRRKRFKLARATPCQGEVRHLPSVTDIHWAWRRACEKMNLFRAGSRSGGDFTESINLDYKNPKVSCTDSVKGRKNGPGFLKLPLPAERLTLFRCLQSPRRSWFPMRKDAQSNPDRGPRDQLAAGIPSLTSQAGMTGRLSTQHLYEF